MLETLKIIAESWENGLFYSKFMTIFYLVIPFVGLLVTYYIEKEDEKKAKNF